MSSHTAGPWKAEASSVSFSLKIVEDKFRGNDIASVWAHNPMSSGAKHMPSMDEMEANARLISAAPELLAALEALLEHAEKYLDFGSVEGKEQAIQLASRAAIAKARGQ